MAGRIELGPPGKYSSGPDIRTIAYALSEMYPFEIRNLFLESGQPSLWVWQLPACSSASREHLGVTSEAPWGHLSDTSAERCSRDALEVLSRCSRGAPEVQIKK